MATIPPPPTGLSTDTLNELILQVQEHGKQQGYAVVTFRSKKNTKQQFVKKAWLRCDRGGKIRETYGQNRTTWALRYSPKLVPTLVYSLIAIVLTSSSPPEQLGEMSKKTVSVLAYDMFEIINDSCLRVCYTTPT